MSVPVRLNTYRMVLKLKNNRNGETVGSNCQL